MYISSALSKVLVAFVAGCAVASAADMKYKVVSYVPNNHTAGVMIDGQVYPLKVQDESLLYFTGKAPVAQTGYKYVILDNANAVTEQENFTRAPVTSGNTYNEYYNRSWNSLSLAQLPTVLDYLPIVHRIDSDLHIDGQIPTIHITGNQTGISYIHEHPQEDIELSMNMAYISLNDAKTFKNVTVKVSGHSSRNTPKLSYQLKLDKNDDTLYKYRRFKLRAMAMDSTYMKDELCYDIANKLGLPTTKNSYVRLYINDQPIGLFGLVEAFKNPWIRNEFANGNKTFNQGAFYVTDFSSGAAVEIPSNMTQKPDDANGSTNAADEFMKMLRGSRSDLTYLGDNIAEYQSQYSLKEDPSVGEANYTRIMELTKFIAQQPNTTMVDDSYADAWEKVLDVESALRTLVFEVATGDGDGYLSMGNNYILYDDLVNERLVMSGQDFDLTMTSMGSNSTVGGNYTEFRGFAERPLSTTLLKVPKYKQRFEELLRNVTSSLVSPDVMYPRIDDIANMISQDVEWDKSLPRVSNSSMGGFSFDTPFSEAINGTNSSQPSNSSNPFNSMSLKKWIETYNNNTLTFLNTTNTA